MRKIGCVAPSEYDTAEHLITDLIKEWRDMWCFSSADSSVFEVFRPKPTQMPIGNDWYLSSSDCGDLWLSVNWRVLLFSHHAAELPDDAICTQLIRAAQTALVSSIQSGLGGEPLSLLRKSTPKKLGATMDTRVLIGFRFDDDMSLLVLLDRDLLKEFFPRVPRELTLAPRVDAIGGMKIKVQTSLSFSSIGADKANELKVGDVLQGGSPLNMPMNLTVETGQIVGSGFLAKKNNKLAMQLIVDQN